MPTRASMEPRQSLTEGLTLAPSRLN